MRRLGRSDTGDEAVEIHRQLIHDHNTLPHYGHRRRTDNKHTPLGVLGSARGREVDAVTRHRAFSRTTWNRQTDAHGFIQIHRWKVYVESGLPQTPVQVMYWDGKLRAEYQAHVLAEYRCRWDATAPKPKSISHPRYYQTPFPSRQMVLFDPLWTRDPIEGAPIQKPPKKAITVAAKQLRLYLGPELVKV